MICDIDFHQADNGVILQAHACGWRPITENVGRLCLLSAAGSKTSVTGVAAMLRSRKEMSMKIRMPGEVTSLVPDQSGYHCWNHLLGMDTYHLLAVSKDVRLLPENNDDHLWAQFRSERYTTPILRDWIPELRRELIEQKVLWPLEGFNHNAAYMVLSDEVLDHMVSSGVKSGRMRIPKRSA